MKNQSINFHSSADCSGTRDEEDELRGLWDQWMVAVLRQAVGDGSESGRPMLSNSARRCCKNWVFTFQTSDVPF